MITFRCPECGENMEASDRKAGMAVECVRCSAMVELPGQTRQAAKPSRQQKDIFSRDHLTTLEFVLTIVIFLPMAGCNLFIGVILYFVLQEKYPTKGYQILQAAIISCGIMVLSGCLLGSAWVLVASKEPPPIRRELKP